MGGVFVRKERVTRRWVVIGAAWVLGVVGCQSAGTTTAVVAEKPAPAPVVEKIRPEKPAPRAAKLSPVYFELDADVLHRDARRTLEKNAKEILDKPYLGVIAVEGHCDERGSEAYNLALGERRAQAVKRYLQELGVPSARLEVVSFGESKPAVYGHDESAWSRNRRSALRPATRQLSQR